MPTTTTFNYTGGTQTFVVPANVTSLTIAAKGAGGGNATGGPGGLATGTQAVTPGETLTIQVGGAGAANAGAVLGAGGYNGGGNGGSTAGTGALSGSGGGGASDVRRGGSGLANRVCVAAGGGGAGAQAGGQGGGATGTAGTAGGTSNGGGGGTQAAGGAAGTGSGGGGGTAGTQTAGGLGGTVSGTNARGGGGGGGGYWGGGGGYSGIGAGLGGGGGGGSSYLGAMTGAVTTAGGGAAASANGSVVLTYDSPPAVPALTGPANGGYFDPALPLTFSWTFSDPDVTDTQSAADIRYRIGAGAWTTVAGAATTGASWTAPGGTFATGNQYEWQAQVYDQSAVASGWSASSFFNAASPPAAPTITAPISIVAANPATVQWTTPGAQVAYQIRYVGDDGSGNAVTTTVYSDTGQVNSASQSVALGLGTAIQGGTLHVQVRHQQNPGVWSAWADSGAETINVGQPGIPTLAFVVTPATGAITVNITNPAVPNATTSNELFRTEVTQVPLHVDYSPLTAVPAAADSGQPLVSSGQPAKIQAGSLAMNFAGSGAQRLDAQYSLGVKVCRMRAEFLIESSTWTTDGALLGLLALSSPYVGGTLTGDSHCYLTVGRTSWALAYVSGGTLSTLLSGTYAALTLDTAYAVEVAFDQYQNKITVWLPDGSVRTVTSAVLANLTGVVADTMIQLAAANTDRRPRVLNLWASGLSDFGEVRLASGLPAQGSYVDLTPASTRQYRYRVVAHAFFGGSQSSA